MPDPGNMQGTWPPSHRPGRAAPFVGIWVRLVPVRFLNSPMAEWWASHCRASVVELAGVGFGIAREFLEILGFKRG